MSKLRCIEVGESFSHCFTENGVYKLIDHLVSDDNNSNMNNIHECWLLDGMVIYEIHGDIGSGIVAKFEVVK